MRQLVCSYYVHEAQIEAFSICFFIRNQFGNCNTSVSAKYWNNWTLCEQETKLLKDKLFSIIEFIIFIIQKKWLIWKISHFSISEIN